MGTTIIILFVILFLLFDLLIIFRFIFREREFSKEFVEEIKRNLEKIKDHSLEKQIFEYEKILELCLKMKKIKGNTLGEKIKSYKNMFLNKNSLWQAHKLRNKIAHEIGFNPSQKELEMSSKTLRREICNLIENS